jgi:hypothetical protein
MITATKVAAGTDVYDVDFSALDGIGDLEGEVYRVKFEGRGDESDRLMFANQLSCTVKVASGSSLTDEATVSDENGNEVSGSVTFG